ncbi:MAG: TetR/AcrR family transcriptional regulator [Rhodospirillaceae bacterium]|jgi:AcrR family transcriptional regulator|nr:TetR/AcrR family transcriptional regulator [Rhodospirillaceae bacterium]|tara:strand:+ start:419 stop:1048 length:630 start_codon:yes stop_codon:yes gene_type:complete
MSGAVLDKKNARAAQKEARPKEIVDAALAVFARDGFAGARLDDVAEKVGISKGTIYLYFDTKEELFKACVRETVGAHIAGSRDFAASYEGATSGLLRELVGRIGDRMSKGDFRTILLLLISESSRFPELVSFYHTEIISSGLEVLSAVIQRGVDSGEFRKTGLETYPMLLISPLIMSVIWNHLFSSMRQLDVDVVLKAHLDTILDGLRA